MEHKPDELERESGIPAHPEGTAIAASVAAGAVAGIAVGIFSFAGPVAVAIGGLVGAVAGGAIAKVVRQRSKRQDAKDAILDREIGVIGGDIGSSPP
jgi:phage tail tape-measure protein